MKEPNWFQFQYGKDRGELQITHNIQKLLLLNGVIINYAHCCGINFSCGFFSSSFLLKMNFIVIVRMEIYGKNLSIRRLSICCFFASIEQTYSRSLLRGIFFIYRWGA